MAQNTNNESKVIELLRKQNELLKKPYPTADELQEIKKIDCHLDIYAETIEVKDAAVELSPDEITDIINNM